MRHVRTLIGCSDLLGFERDVPDAHGLRADVAETMCLPCGGAILCRTGMCEVGRVHRSISDGVDFL